jgi:hypothetical protein
MPHDERALTQDFLRALMREQYRASLEEKVDKRIKSIETETEAHVVEEEALQESNERICERDLTKDFLKQILSE